MHLSFSSILLLCVVFVVGQQDMYDVIIPRLIPMYGREYFVTCLLLVLPEANTTQLYTQQLQFSNNKNVSNCQVSNWRYCGDPVAALTDGQCGCHSKQTTAKGNVIFQFYLYIRKVYDQYIDLLFTCQIGASTETRQLEIVRFAKQPPRQLYACRESALILNWEFNPKREYILNNYKVYFITWRTNGVNNSVWRLGSYYRYDNEGNITTVSADNGNKGIKFLVNGSILPQLLLSDLQRFQKTQNITISVTFNVSYENESYLQLKRHAVWLQKTKFLTLSRIRKDDTTATIALTGTTKEPTTTTTPTRINISLRNTATSMEDRNTLFIPEPPSLSSRVVMKTVESITGNLIVTCQIYHMEYGGFPDVNLTIRRDDVVELTIQGNMFIHYATDATGEKISCGIDGESLKCLDVDDPRLRRDERRIKDMEKTNAPARSADVFVTMYAWQSIMTVVLILWTLSLILDHISFIIRNKRYRMSVDMNMKEKTLGRQAKHRMSSFKRLSSIFTSKSFPEEM